MICTTGLNGLPTRPYQGPSATAAAVDTPRTASRTTTTISRVPTPNRTASSPRAISFPPAACAIRTRRDRDLSQRQQSGHRYAPEQVHQPGGVQQVGRADGHPLPDVAERGPYPLHRYAGQFGPGQPVRGQLDRGGVGVPPL